MKKFDHKTYPEIKIILKPSKLIPGEVGAFSMKNIKKGEIIVKAEEFNDDNTMTIDEYNKLDITTKNLVKAHSTITETLIYLPSNLNYLRPMNYFNHSCSPNTGFNLKDDYVAIKNIKKGEEFLLDYSFLNTNPDYKLKCFCKNKNCRKIITGNEWRNTEFVKKNSKYFASTLRDAIKLFLK